MTRRDEPTMTPTTIDAEDATAAPFDAVDQALADGPAAALERLVAWQDERNDARGLLDALLLKARHELGLPLVQVGPLGEIPEPQRSQYEDRYVEAIRRVGRKLLDAGDLVGAWPYYRVLGERDEISKAHRGLHALRRAGGRDARAGRRRRLQPGRAPEARASS